MEGVYIKKLLMVAGTVTSIGLASFASLGLASAHTANTESAGLVDKIAQKFNLNKADVQKIFDQDRAAHRAEHEQKQAERLSQAVKDGKLTQAQADLIAAKQKELHTKREANREAMEKTEAERKAAMDKEREELKQWRTDNNIPEGYLMGRPGGGRHHGGPPPRDIAQ